MFIELECDDCKGKVLFNSLASGSEGERPSQSWCRCIDREKDKGKIIKNVIYEVQADYNPQKINLWH